MGPVLLPVSPVRPPRWGAAWCHPRLSGRVRWPQWLECQSPEGLRKPRKPALFAQLCGGILPASQACGRVSGPWLSQFLPSAEGPSVSHCTHTRFPQLPWNRPGLPGLVTGSQPRRWACRRLRNSRLAVPAAGDLGVSCSGHLGPYFVDGETESPRGRGVCPQLH